MLYSIQHTVYYYVGPIISCTIYYAACNIMYSIQYTVQHTVQYNVQNTKWWTSCKHCTLLCSTQNIPFKILRALTILHAQCMQDNVQHTVQYNVQNTSYMILDIMLHAVHYSGAPSTSRSIHHYVQYTAYNTKYNIHPVVPHTTHCTLSWCTYSMMYKIIYSIQHYVLYTRNCATW